ncbi:hypothetical protein MUO66_01605 [Candidatus Bathyarchaeota archaeon]|nr:hypothetical protein [Candidatus Bathyarchaeota archaeon]
MASRLQKITLLPALVMFILSILFAWVSLIVVDFSLRQGFLILIMGLFIGGLTYTVYWGYSWFWSKKVHESNNSLLFRILSQNKLLVIIFFICGLVTFVWVFSLIWNDVFVWNKDIGLIFFGSRVGEPISLGIGVRLVHYFFVSLTFFLIGLVLLVHNFRSCPFYFGYLGSIYRKNRVSLKCFKCPLEKDCRMTDNRSQTPK